MKRTLQALSFILISLTLFCLVMHFINPPDPVEKEKQAFFASKFLDQKRYPCLIAGDSRAYRGLDPQIISEILQAECFNLGFDSAGFGPDFFDLVEKRLSTSSEKILIIAVSPHSVTERGAENNQLAEYLKMAPSQIRQIMHPSALDDFFPRIPMDHFLHPSFAKENPLPHLNERYLKNGFAPAFQDKNDPAQAVASYQNLFKDHFFSQHVEDSLLSKLREYQLQGIHVYVLRLPVSKEIRAAEDSLARFDETDLQKRLAEIGTPWIPLELKYETFDGSHLTAASAQKVSTEVAQRIHDEVRK